LITEIKPDFHLPTEIYVRHNIVEEIAQIISEYGSRVVIVTTSHDFEIYFSVITNITYALKQAGIGCITYDELSKNPNTEEIDTAISFISKTNCDLIIGLGGIESINSGKLVALLTNNSIFCNDLFSNKTLRNNPVKFITMPTLPVFGFEIAPILFINSIDDLTKQFYTQNNLYPCATIVDPLLSMPIESSIFMKNSISTLAMAVESVISKVNNEIVNTYALKAIDLIFRNLPAVYNDPENMTPRRYLSIASIMSGITFSTSYLSAVLAISLSLSGWTDIELTSSMSVLLPHIMEFNLTTSYDKYVHMSKVMGEDTKGVTAIEAAIKSIEAIRKLESDIDLPLKLSEYNIDKSEFKKIAEISISYPFLKNAPRELNINEVETLLISAY
jgi:alcohol dehydrogenase class IV